jgi:hypothetical protein
MEAHAQGTIDLASAALRYGPFLFAILFVLVVPPYAHAIWRRSFTATKDPAELNELLTEGRLYFRYSWLFGVFLVLCSILWWGYTQDIDRSMHAYTGTIIGLQTEDQLSSAAADDNDYLVPTPVGSQVQYRFVYLSPQRLTDPLDLYVSYVNNAAPLADGKGALSLLIVFKLKPDKKDYKFFIDPTKGAMIAPLDGGSS